MSPHQLWRRLRALFRKDALDADMNAEMRAHLEFETEDGVRRGLSRDEAYRQARLAFGGADRFREEGREARGVQPFHDLMQDVRYAFRVLGKSPGFTAASVLTLALGMAATTVVVSVINALMVRRLAVDEPDRLFVVAEYWKGGMRSVSTDMGQYSYPYAHYLDLRDATSSVFSGLAGYRLGSVSLRGEGGARTLSAISASANYFQVLGLRPALGLLFSDTAEHFGAAVPEVVLSYDLWRSEYAGDSAVVGRTLSIDSRLHTIVGVAPRGFQGTAIGLLAEVWLPAAGNARPPAETRPGGDVRRRAGSVTMFGRLRPDLSRERALAALATIGPNLPAEQPAWRIRDMSLDPISGVPAMSRGAVLGFTGMLLLTAGLVLLIAAANVAGMLLARAAQRRREIAVRLAIGASRGRLVRQLLTESVTLCLLGGVAGLLLTIWLASLIPVAQPPGGLRVRLDIGVDAVVLAVAFAVSVAAGVFTGLTPAFQFTRPDLLSGLRIVDIGQPRQARARDAFVVAQLALSLVLLITAGLFTRALQRALVTDPGLDARGVVVTQLDVSAHGYRRERGEAFFATLVERLAGRPEIASVALGQWTPLSMGHKGEDVTIPGESGPDRRRFNITWGVMGPGYLELMRIPLLAGRSFTSADARHAAQVAVINETMAARLWPGVSPIGQRMDLNGVREVVGVVRDGKYRGLDEGPTGFAFVPVAQDYSPRLTVHVRARGETGAALAALRTEVAGLDPNVALEGAGPLTDELAIYTLPQRAAAWVVGLFGLVGLLLASVGIYGVIAFQVAQRAREFAIRIALGARGRHVLGRALDRALRVIGIGLTVGVLLALGSSRLIARFLFGVGAADPLTFIVVPLLLGIVALLASVVPATRAIRVDPVATLRAE